MFFLNLSEIPLGFASEFPQWCRLGISSGFFFFQRLLQKFTGEFFHEITSRVPTEVTRTCFSGNSSRRILRISSRIPQGLLQTLRQEEFRSGIHQEIFLEIVLEKSRDFSRSSFKNFLKKICSDLLGSFSNELLKASLYVCRYVWENSCWNYWK